MSKYKVGDLVKIQPDKTKLVSGKVEYAGRIAIITHEHHMPGTAPRYRLDITNRLLWLEQQLTLFIQPPEEAEVTIEFTL